MRGEREKRETTAIESQENAAMPLQLPLPHGRHDGGSNKGLPYARVQSSEHPYGRVERGFSTASLGRGHFFDNHELRLPRNPALSIRHDRVATSLHSRFCPGLGTRSSPRHPYRRCPQTWFAPRGSPARPPIYG